MTQPRIESSVQHILDKARSAEAELMKALRDTQEREARTERARRAWLRVAGFRGDAIPAGLTGRALWRRYSELIVELGQVLRNDGWQADVEAIAPGPRSKQCAVEVLRQAMNGDADHVATLVEAFVDTLFSLGLRADSWLREGLMYEVLGISPSPVSLFFDQGEAEEAVGAEASHDHDEARPGEQSCEDGMAEVGRPGPQGKPMSTPENPFPALDRFARGVCATELADLVGRVPALPLITTNRRERQRQEGERVAEAAKVRARELGISFQDWEQRWHPLNTALWQVWNGMGRPWSVFRVNVAKSIEGPGQNRSVQSPMEPIRRSRSA
jgi:hypothetical protein